MCFGIFEGGENGWKCPIGTWEAYNFEKCSVRLVGILVKSKVVGQSIEQFLIDTLRGLLEMQRHFKMQFKENFSLASTILIKTIKNIYLPPQRNTNF